MTQDQFDLQTEVEHLWELVQRACKPTDPLYSCFYLAVGRKTDDDADFGRMALARLTFFRMTAAQQRRVLNGWSPDDSRSGRTSMLHELERQPMRRVLSLAHDPTRNAADPLQVGFDYVFTDSAAPVQVFVREGATQHQALDALECFTLAVRAAWQVLVEEDADLPTVEEMLAKEKSGKPSKHATRQAGNSKGDRAGASTAA